MSVRRMGPAVAVALGLLAAAGCGSTTDSSSSTASAGAGGAPSVKTIQSGQLQICSDISTPPMESYGPGHEPVGADIDVGNEIAQRLDLMAVWKNTAFAGIVPALQAGNCDAIISQLFDKPERRKVVDFVDYLKSGQALLVAKGNPKGITGLDGLCGKTAASETGTTIAELLRAQSKKCEAAGQGKITVRLFLRDSDALQQLGLGQVDAYGTTTETVAFVTKQQPGKFEVAGAPFGEIDCGIATRKDNAALHAAIAKAFAAMQGDGTYKKILAKYNLQIDELPAGGGA
jgi:polar amino acid transport system substrate-binding protein